MVCISSNNILSSSSSNLPSKDGINALASSGVSGHKFAKLATSNLCNFLDCRRLKIRRVINFPYKLTYYKLNKSMLFQIQCIVNQLSK